MSDLLTKDEVVGIINGLKRFEKHVDIGISIGRTGGGCVGSFLRGLGGKKVLAKMLDQDMSPEQIADIFIINRNDNICNRGKGIENPDQGKLLAEEKGQIDRIEAMLRSICEKLELQYPPNPELYDLGDD